MKAHSKRRVCVTAFSNRAAAEIPFSRYLINNDFAAAAVKRVLLQS